jgi:hypothetical protein
MLRSSHRFVVRLLLGQLMLALLMSLSFEAHAQFNWDDRYGDEPQSPGDFHYDDRYGDQLGRGQMLSERVSQVLYDRQQLDLAQELRLPYGAEIISLTVVARAHSRIGALQLLSDGYAEGMPQPLSRDLRHIPLLLPHRGSSRLAIEARGGDIFIDEIIAEVSSRHSPYPGQSRSIQLRLSQRVYGQAIIGLKALAQQQGHRLEGLEISSVSLDALVTGRSRAEARLIVNQIPGMWVSIDTRSYETLLPVNAYGDVRSLQLEIRGDVSINGVTLELGRGGGRPGHQIPRELRVLGRDFHGPQTSSLLSAFSISYQHSSRLVNSIVIDASTMGRGVLQLRRAGMRGPLDRIPALSRYSQPIRILLPEPIPLSELELTTVDHVRVDSMTLEFLR